MGDPTEPTEGKQPPADEVSGAGYGNNAQEDEDRGGGDGAEGRPDEL